MNRQAWRKTGFIHCSRIDQVLRVANAFYKDLEDLLLLCIATEELEAEVKYEDLLGEGMSFPHLYGPLNLDAVAAVFELQKDSGGNVQPAKINLFLKISNDYFVSSGGLLDSCFSFIKWP